MDGPQRRHLLATAATVSALAFGVGWMLGRGGSGTGSGTGAAVPTTAVAADRLADGVELLVTTGLASSRTEARRLLDQRGVRVNGTQLSRAEELAEVPLLHDRFVLLRKGKHTYHLVEVAGR